MKSPLESKFPGIYFLLFSIVAFSLCFTFQSCQEDMGLLPSIKNEVTTDYLLNGNLDIYLQNNQIFRYKGKPGVDTIPIGNVNLSRFEPCFVLHVASGTTTATMVSSAIIKLDGQEILNTYDFSKNNVQYKFEVCNLTPTSVITIEVRGEPGSFIEIWIEGKLKQVIPKDGLIAYYPFNGNANDESGNGNHGIVNNASPADDRFGKTNSAYRFNSVISEILFLNPQFLNLGNQDYTINGWFKVEDPEGTEQLLLFSTQPDGVMTGGIAICINYTGSGENLMYFMGNGLEWNIAFKLTSNITAPHYSWHMFSVVKQGDTYSHYIDGQLDITYSSDILKSIPFWVSFRIGLSGQGEVNPHDFIGILDDYSFYQRALTFDEITKLYHYNGWDQN